MAVFGPFRPEIDPCDHHPRVHPKMHRAPESSEQTCMASPTVDDHFEIVTSTAYWMAKQLPYRVQRTPLVRVGSAALAHAIAIHDPESEIGLETWCRQEVRRAIRDFISDRFEA